MFLDSDGAQNLFLLACKRVEMFNDYLVIYVDSKAGGFGDTSIFADNADVFRAAISARGFSVAGRSDVTFPSGFQADYAIAMKITPPRDFLGTRQRRASLAEL